MKVLISQRALYGFAMCVSYMMTMHANTISFSFDQLYPTTAISRALQALRQVLSLTEDFSSDQYDTNMARSLWLELYISCDQMVTQKHGNSIIADVMSYPEIPDDLRIYIKTIWHLIDIAYDQVAIKDIDFGQFLSHIRIACRQLIDQV